MGKRRMYKSRITDVGAISSDLYVGSEWDEYDLILLITGKPRPVFFRRVGNKLIRITK